MSDLLEASALEQAAAVRRGEVSAVELMDATLRAAERLQSELRPFAAIDAERALAGAATVAAGDPRPFAGVPYAAKDASLPCAGLPLTNGSWLFGDYRSDHDSVVMSRAHAAGLITIGRTTSSEFGLSPVTEPQRYGPVRNPHDPARTPGGSSGGSAAAVAGGVLAIASASDAGGSSRVPAACCGLVGLKASRGRVSLGPAVGDHPFAVEGCVTRTVADTAAFLDVVAGPSAGDPTVLPGPPESFAASAGTPGPRLRIGLCTEPQFPGLLTDDRAEAARRVARLLADRGHHVEEIDGNPWPGDEITEAFLDAFGLGAAGNAALGEGVGGQLAGPGTVEPLTWSMIRRGRSRSALDLALVGRTLHGWSVSVARKVATYDVVLSPTIACAPLPVGTLAAHGGDVYGAMGEALSFVAYTLVANVTGRPALALPAGVDAAGLPVSVQLLGRPADEATLLVLGTEIEGLSASPAPVRGG